MFVAGEGFEGGSIITILSFFIEFPDDEGLVSGAGDED